MQKLVAFIVPHTHWDREWYLTAEEFRFYLCKALDEVFHLLEKRKEYKFTLDGQVLPLLDYLAVKPEKEKIAKRFIKTGRLCIGPWFSQPDEFLVSGESIIRNLLLGIQISKAFGGAMLHGYVPDAFGHIAQLPQLFNGFGIETAFVMRGAEEAAEKLGTNEFLWVAPDGSRVACHVLETGYCNAVEITSNLSNWVRSFKRFIPGLSFIYEKKAISQILQFLAKRSQTGAALLLYGCDHRGANKVLFSAIQALSKTMPRWDFVIATLEDYGRILRKILESKKVPKVYGEFRRSVYHPILPGVLSTRIYLKQKEVFVETLLEKYAEPLAALAMLKTHSDFRALLRRAWYTLLQNNAHDSICGTGIDEVHKEMMVRYAQAQSIAHLIVQESMQTMGQDVMCDDLETGSVLVFNPLPWPQASEVKIYIKDMKANCLKTSDGTVIPLVSVKNERIIACENILKGVRCTEKRAILFHDEFPAFGIKTYKLLQCRNIEKRKRVIVTSDAIENEFYLVHVNANGTFDVVDKQNNLEFYGLHIFEDLGDRGDEYNFDPIPNDSAITTHNLKASIQAKRLAPWKAALIVKLKLPIPRSLRKDRIQRSRQKVIMPICVTLILQSRVKRVDILTELKNTAKDHRLRVLFPTGWAEPKIFVDKTFAVLESPIGVLLPRKGGVECPVPTMPQKAFVALEKNGNGFALINRGLPECEVTGDGKICLTLLRAVGWLSRDDLYTRTGHAGPALPTPEAQCYGNHAFNYALYSYKGTWHSSGLLPVAHAFLAGPIGTEVSSTVLLTESFISLDREEIVMSACKPAEDGSGVVIRFYNACGKPIKAQIRLKFPVKEIWLTRLDETPIAPLKINNEILKMEFGKWQIKTLKLVLKKIRKAI